MRLQAAVNVRRAPDEVRAFLADLRNIPLWDRGVAGVRVSPDARPGIGYAFETLGHQNSAGGDGRMAYELSALGPEGTTVRLTSTAGNARYFKDAAWHVRLDPVPEGTRITCAAEFTLRLRYMFLAPVLYLLRRAIRDDLERIRRALETA